MFYYFGYGSNINLISLRAKGVEPVTSQKATLRGWRLRFNVQHWFRHEGGMGNIEPGTAEDRVEGMVYLCEDAHLASMDAMESFGVAYDRIAVLLETETDPITAWAYVGLPDFIDNSCLPSRRYLNIILKGANAAGLSEEYIKTIESQTILQELDYPEFQAPKGNFPTYTPETLASQPHLTALSGSVFDMRGARKKLEVITDLFGGKDMTLFHLKRHDSSTGKETLEDVSKGQISEAGKKYINAYLNEYSKEFRYAGRYSFDTI